MGLSAPWAALFGIAVPLIILLWLLKRKRLDRVVSSTYLWEQVLKDPRANAPWQRLRRNLLMILQVLAAALLTLALLRPYLTGDLGARAQVVLIVDISGSMQARSAAGTRLEEAVAKALDLVEGAGRQDRFTVIAAGPLPKVLVAGTAEKHEVRAALRSLRPSNGSANLPQALSLAGSFSGAEGFAAVLFTDGAEVPATDFPLEVVRLGRPANNLAVERLTMQGSLALARVVNHGPSSMPFVLELYGLEGSDAVLLDVRSGTLEPGRSHEVIFKNVPARFRGFQARLAGQMDELPADDVAYAAASGDHRTRVLLVSRGNTFLEKALSLRDGLQLVRATPAQYGPGDFSLYIFDGWLPETLPAGAVWSINPPAGSLVAGWLVSGEIVESVGAIRAGERLGNLLDHLTLEEIRVARVRSVTAPAWADTVIEATAGPLLLTGRPGNRPTAVLLFDLHDSNLPLRVAFPVLVNNLVNWLSPQQPVAPETLAGEAMPLMLDPVASEVFVVTPGGRKVPVAPPIPAPPWTETEELGLYRLVQVKAGKEEETVFAVNFPREESAGSGREVAGQRQEPARQPAAQASGKSDVLRRTNREIWPWFAGFALAVMALEWWVYTRGR
jgi:Ca-activated chloride channel homolog